MCVPATGCKYTYNQAPCDDGNKCTTGDTCQGGSCLGTGQMTCNDFNPCTTDTCDSQLGCSYELNTLPCNDDSACTENDTCAAGVCQGQAVGCDDGNVCTSDACDAQLGCTFAAVAGPCEDGDPCTTGDSCQLGKCQSGNSVDCDDSNPCTQDDCGVDGQCLNAPLNGIGCDDGNECTGNDVCVAGICQGEGNESCCLKDSDCNDNNPCTKDICMKDTGQCVSQAAPMNGLSCNADFNGCTAGDQCQEGICVVGDKVDCSNQSDVCGDALCESTGIQTYQCVKVPKGEGEECDDQLFCTVDDKCDDDGNCVGQPLDCSKLTGGCIDGNCNEELDKCEGNPLPDNTLCDADNNGCTQADSCLDGDCIPGAHAVCQAIGDCYAGVCNSTGPHTYECEQTFKPEGSACDDKQFCATGDSCDGFGLCQGTEENPCLEVQDQCNDSTCDEAQDVCLPVPKVDGVGCTDGDSCTTGDKCENGICVGSENVCGEYKVSTFHTAASPFSPAVADYGEGRYGVFWNDSSQDRYYGRSYTDTWSKEWEEFEAYESGTSSSTTSIDHLHIDADGLTDGGGVVGFVHRKKVYSQTKHTNCKYQKSSSNSCAQGYCCSSCSSSACKYSSCYSRKYNKYSGSKSMEERIYLRWFDGENSVVRTVEVTANNQSSSWSYKCSSVAAHSYTSGFGDVRVSASSNGRVGVLWESGSKVYGHIYESDGSLKKNLGQLGSNWSGFDIAGHIDDSFIVVWSDGSDIRGRHYSGTGNPLDVAKALAAGAGSQTNPVVEAFDSTDFVVAWQTDEDGSQDIRARVFDQTGIGSGSEAKVNTGDNGGETHPSVGVFDINYVVAWEGVDPAGRGIYARFFNQYSMPVTGEKMVNVKTAGNQTLPFVESLSTEQAVIAWRGGSGSVWARKYDSKGEAVTDSEEVVQNSDADLEQKSPAAARQGDTGYVVVWDTNTLASEQDIRARRFLVNGEDPEDEFTVNQTTAGGQQNPAVDTAPDGSFVVVWQGWDNLNGGDDIYYRLYGEDGVAASGEVLVNSEHVTDNQQTPAVAVDPNDDMAGDFIVGWISKKKEGGHLKDVVAKCFDSKGVAKEAGPPLDEDEFIVNSEVDNNQDSVAVGALHQDLTRYVVVWASYDGDDSYGIYGRRLDSNCLPQGQNQFDVATSKPGTMPHPAVAAAADGSFIVAWIAPDGSGNGVFAQKFTANVMADGEAFRLNRVVAGMQSYPTMAYLTDGTFIAGWKTVGEDEEGTAVKFRRFAADKTPLGLDYLGNVFYASDQDSPVVTPLADGEYVIVWRSNNQDSSGGLAGDIIGRLLP